MSHATVIAVPGCRDREITVWEMVSGLQSRHATTAGFSFLLYLFIVTSRITTWWLLRVCLRFWECDFVKLGINFTFSNGNVYTSCSCDDKLIPYSTLHIRRPLRVRN